MPMREAMESYMWPGSGRHLLRNESVAGGIDKAEDEQPTEDRQLAEPQEQHHEEAIQQGQRTGSPAPSLPRLALWPLLSTASGHGPARSHGPRQE